MRIGLSHYSKFIKLFLVFAVWFACFLILLELTLRLLGFLYLRIPDLNKAARKDNFNIVCLGDSITYGWGVDRENNYPRQLEKMLNQRDHKIHFKVFNLAVPGSSSSQHLKYLEDILDKNKNVDLVVVLTGANDPWNFADSNIYMFIGKKGFAERLNIKLRILLSNFRTYKMLKIILLNSKGMPSESGIDCFRQVRRYEKVGKEILQALLEYNLTEMAKLAQRNKIKIILQSYPRRQSYGMDLAQEVALRYHVPFVNHSLTFYEKLKKSNLADLFLYDNTHPNKQGY